MVAVDSVAVSRFLTQLLFVGITGSIVTSFLFVLEYTGREHAVTHRMIALLSIEPICVVMLAFVNHGRVFIEAVTSDPTVPSGITVEPLFAELPNCPTSTTTSRHASRRPNPSWG